MQRAAPRGDERTRSRASLLMAEPRADHSYAQIPAKHQRTTAARRSTPAESARAAWRHARQARGACGHVQERRVAHFRSIEDVQIALLDHTAQCVAPLVVEPALRAPEGLPRIDALMRAWFGWTARAGLPGGCPVAAAMFELDDVEGPVRDKVLELELGWRALLQQQVEAAVRLGHLHSELDVEQFIFELCGIYLIHHVSLRFVREPSSDARAHRALEGLIARSRPPNS